MLSKRIQNRILQALYRPRKGRNPLTAATGRLISGDALTFLDELDNQINEKITPLLAELL